MNAMLGLCGAEAEVVRQLIDVELDAFEGAGLDNIDPESLPRLQLILRLRRRLVAAMVAGRAEKNRGKFS